MVSLINDTGEVEVISEDSKMSCFFFFQSLCGKNLTTILNEYVAMKTKGKSTEWGVVLFLFICCELLEEEVYGLRVIPHLGYSLKVTILHSQQPLLLVMKSNWLS